MRRLVLLLVPAVLVACAKPDDAPPAADTTAAAMTAAPTVSLADFAGTWQVRGTNEAGDSIVGYQLTASADAAGWSITFPGRDPVPLRVLEVAGDSLVAEGGPFESAIRKGVQVSTHTVMRIQDGRLTGMTTARYATSGADSVVMIRADGTRMP